MIVSLFLNFFGCFEFVGKWVVFVVVLVENMGVGDFFFKVVGDVNV